MNFRKAMLPAALGMILVLPLAITYAQTGGEKAKAADKKKDADSAAKPGAVKRGDDTIKATHEITSPRDAQSGQATGKRMHKPLKIYKDADAAKLGGAPAGQPSGTQTGQSANAPAATDATAAAKTKKADASNESPKPHK